MKSLSRENQAGVIGSLIDIDNVYYYQMVDRMCSASHSLSEASSSDTEAPFFGGLSMYIEF